MSDFISLHLISLSGSRDNTSGLPELLGNEIAHRKECQAQEMSPGKHVRVIDFRLKG
jgi:hypothetical protein